MRNAIWMVVMLMACGSPPPDGDASDGGSSDGGIADTHLADTASADVATFDTPEPIADGGPDAPSCTASPGDPDTDGDGVVDRCDVCPEVANPRQLDVDGDGIGWACDAFEAVPPPVHDGSIGYAYGAFALRSADRLLSVQRGEIALSGMPDGEDPVLLGGRGAFDPFVVSGETTLFISRFPPAFLRIDDGIVTAPLGVLAAPGILQTMRVGSDVVVAHATSDGSFAISLSRREETVELGRFPAQVELCGVESGLVLTGGVERALRVVADGALRPVTVDGVEVEIAPGQTCTGDYVCRNVPGGTLQTLMVEPGGAAHVVLDSHHPRSACGATHTDLASGHGRFVFVTADASSTLETALVTVVVQDDVGDELGFLELEGMDTPDMLLGDTGLHLRWRRPTVPEATSGRIEFWAFATGTVTEVADVDVVHPHAVALGDRHAVYGRTTITSPFEAADARLVVTEGDRLVLERVLAGPGDASQVVLGHDVTIVRHGSQVEAWRDGGTAPTIIATDATWLGGVAFDDVTLISLGRSSGDTAFALRVVDDALESVERADLIGLYPFGEDPFGRWMTDDARMVRVSVDGDGSFRVDESVPGGPRLAGRFADRVALVISRDEEGQRLVRLGEHAQVLAVGSRIDVHAVDGTRVVARVQTDDGDFLCQLDVEPEAVACWSLSSWPDGVSALTPRDVTSFGAVVRSGDDLALFRPVGAPDRTTPF